MTGGFVLSLSILAGSALFLGRNVHASAKGRIPASWVSWLWLAVWAAAVVFGFVSAIARFARDGGSSPLLVVAIAIASVFCWFRMGRHVEARANYAPHGLEKVVRGTEVVAGSDLQAGMYGSKAKPADVDIEIGGVVIPRMLEAQHMLFSGTTGAGKTQAINRVLRAVRQRRQRALIANAGSVP